MWDIPGYRVRAYIQGKRKERAEAKEKPRNKIHFQRTEAEIRVMPDGPEGHEEVVPARVILNDLYPLGIFIFTPTPLMPGHECAVTIPEPRRFYAKGRVTSCKEIASNYRVLHSESAFRFRTAIEFEFDSPYEAESVREYVEELAADFLYMAT